jgi:pimeloyl-ACP methyl ester carboxylesterase
MEQTKSVGFVQSKMFFVIIPAIFKKGDSLMKHLLLLLSLLILGLPSFAQADLAGEEIQLEAEDGLMLAGDFYRPGEIAEPLPSILLMHQNNANRSTFEPLIPYLLEAGYNVINVDLRGFGATGGARDFTLALGDVQTWFNWLREQEGVDGSRIAVIGASIGSNLALMGCGRDEACVTAVALSPGENYFGIQPRRIMQEGLNAFLIASHRDAESVTAVEEFFAVGSGLLSARLYTGSAHGTNLFIEHLEGLSAAIVAWLEEQFAAVE